MNRERSELAVGLTVLVAFGVFFYSTLRLGSCSPVGSQGIQIAAHFDDAAGVAPRTDVSVAGVRVGQVEKVELSAGRARLVLRVDHEGLEIPLDSTVGIRSRGLLGERVVEIRPGTSERMALDGDTLTRTREATNFDALLDSLATVSDDVAQVTRSMRVVMGGAEGEEAVAAIVGDIRAVAREMRALVEENEDSFTLLVGNLATVSDNLETFSASLAMLGEDDQSLGDLFATFQRTSTELETVVGQLASVGARIERGEGTLGRLLKDDELYTKLDGSVAELQKTLVEVRRAAEEAQEQLPVTVLGSVVGSLF